MKNYEKTSIALALIGFLILWLIFLFGGCLFLGGYINDRLLILTGFFCFVICCSMTMLYGWILKEYEEEKEGYL